MKKLGGLIMASLVLLPALGRPPSQDESEGPGDQAVTFDVRIINSKTFAYQSGASVTNTPAKKGETVTFTGIITDSSFYFDKWSVQSDNHSFTDNAHNPLSFYTQAEHYIVSFFISPK